MRVVNLFALTIAALVAGSAMADEANVSHPFVCADIHKKQVAKFDANGELVWSFGAPMLHDVWGLKNGNVLISGTVQGVQEVTPDKEVVWQYKDPNGDNIYSCQPLPNGDVVVGIGKKKGTNHPNKIVEVR